MIKEKRLNRNYIIYKRQDEAIAELANQSPSMEKSAIVRLLIDLGIIYLKKSEAAQKILYGESIESIEALIDRDMDKAA